MKKRLSAIIFILAILSSMFSLNAYAAEMNDGIYEVQIALWHSEDDKESMAASAVEAKATIEVENGVKTMHIKSGEMSMMGIKASLQELRIADKSGNFTDATVESKDSEGNPTGFYFTMPHTDEYITVKVNPHLAIMGNKDIGARIKVDYSTLKLIKTAETTNAEPETTVVEVVGENGETVTEVATVEAAETPAAEKTTEITQVQTEKISEEPQPEDDNSVVIYVVIALATVVIFIVVRKAYFNK